MQKQPYSLVNLRQLMSTSPAYLALPQAEKDKIEQYIRLNNKTVLLYVYQQLLEENLALRHSREKLAKRILTTDPAAVHGLRRDLRQGFKPTSPHSPEA